MHPRHRCTWHAVGGACVRARGPAERLSRAAPGTCVRPPAGERLAFRARGRSSGALVAALRGRGAGRRQQEPARRQERRRRQQRKERRGAGGRARRVPSSPARVHQAGRERRTKRARRARGPPPSRALAHHRDAATPPRFTLLAAEWAECLATRGARRTRALYLQTLFQQVCMTLQRALSCSSVSPD